MEYGIEIFERVSKKIDRRQPATFYCDIASKLVKLVEESKITVAGQTTGNFIIGTHEATLCSYMLPPYLGAFKRRYPQITISINEVVENDIYRALKAGECDMGFIVDLGMNDPDLIFETIQEEEFVIIASPDHPLATKSSIVPLDLNGCEILMSTVGSRCRNLFEKMLRKHQIQYTLAYEINNYETVKKCVMRGLGLTLLPKTIRYS